VCGIFGIVGEKYRAEADSFTSALKHRGPDDSGTMHDDSVKLTLGHTRLSIIDLSQEAHQPMSINGYTIVFNGEIYNYRELRRRLEGEGERFSTDSDTEVILRTYIRYGEETPKLLRGMFAFCIYDGNRKKMFLSRDRFGVKPLIYTFSKGHFRFSSELKPFLKNDIVPLVIDDISVMDYFSYGSIRQPRTIFEDFYTLMPSHSMTVDIESLEHSISRYYDYFENALSLPVIESYEDAVSATRETLERATKYHMVADVDVGAFLSGGVDSTAVVALMQRIGGRRVETFSIGFQGETGVTDETDIARRSASTIGTIHHTTKVDERYIEDIFDDFIESIDQPSIDGINTYIVSKETSGELKVALSGLGGDEIFAGYGHFATISTESVKRRGIAGRLGDMVNDMRPNRFTRPYAMRGKSPEMALEVARRSVSPLSMKERDRLYNTKSRQKRVGSVIQRVSAAEIDGYMLNTLLRDSDITSMAHSLELRPVLLDHELVELALSLPDRFKISGGAQKAIFIDSVRDLLPQEVIQRKKSGFEMPFPLWMNGVLRERVEKAYESETARYLFGDGFVEKSLKRIGRGESKRLDWKNFIFLYWIERHGIEI
jgi:asparagine synthase (glutamine-hydrolysing)